MKLSRKWRVYRLSWFGAKPFTPNEDDFVEFQAEPGWRARIVAISPGEATITVEGTISSLTSDQGAAAHLDGYRQWQKDIGRALDRALDALQKAGTGHLLIDVPMVFCPDLCSKYSSAEVGIRIPDACGIIGPRASFFVRWKYVFLAWVTRLFERQRLG